MIPDPKELVKEALHKEANIGKRRLLPDPRRMVMQAAPMMAAKPARMEKKMPLTLAQARKLRGA